MVYYCTEVFEACPIPSCTDWDKLFLRFKVSFFKILLVSLKFKLQSRLMTGCNMIDHQLKMTKTDVKNQKPGQASTCMRYIIIPTNTCYSRYLQLCSQATLLLCLEYSPPIYLLISKLSCFFVNFFSCIFLPCIFLPFAFCIKTAVRSLLKTVAFAYLPSPHNCITYLCHLTSIYVFIYLSADQLFYESSWKIYESSSSQESSYAARNQFLKKIGNSS